MYFNPRSLTGATHVNEINNLLNERFQSTLPYGSDQFERDFDNLGLYFNPRSLTGATSIGLSLIAFLIISIHAPLRERLKINGKVFNGTKFQSTLPYGSDSLMHTSNSPLTNFNPRSLTGATLEPLRVILRRFIFQSTLPYGSDLTLFHISLPVLNFNPRSLTGATNSFSFICRCRKHFNPRSLTGATYDKLYDAINHDISIHAPLRERHNPANLLPFIQDISIHAPLRERPTCLVSSIPQNRFQSTLPYGSDTSSQRRYFANIHFNPRSLTGATYKIRKPIY